MDHPRWISSRWAPGIQPKAGEGGLPAAALGHYILAACEKFMVWNRDMKRLLALTDDQRAHLLQRYKTEKNVRLRDRLQCVLLKADGRTHREVAAILHTREHTLNDWLDRYALGGREGLCAWETGGSEAWLSHAQLERLKAEADTHAFQSAQQACAWVEEQFGVSTVGSVNAQTVCEWIDWLEASYPQAERISGLWGQRALLSCASGESLSGR